MKVCLLLLTFVSLSVSFFKLPNVYDETETRSRNRVADYYKSSLYPSKLWKTYVSPEKFERFRNLYYGIDTVKIILIFFQ